MCRLNAPQQPWSAGMTTSHPSAASTRAVAAFTPGKKTRCTQPTSIPTLARCGPTAGVCGGTFSGRPSGGASASIAATAGGSRSKMPLRRTTRSRPVRR